MSRGRFQRRCAVDNDIPTIGNRAEGLACNWLYEALAAVIRLVSGQLPPARVKDVLEQLIRDIE